VLLPGWPSPRAIIHAVFPSRRGLVPAVRRFIDFLAVEMSEA
jgi:DNA-binding transcriptional LysR family regulator